MWLPSTPECLSGKRSRDLNDTMGSEDRRHQEDGQES